MSLPFQPFQPKSLSVATGQNNHAIPTDRFKKMVRVLVLWLTFDVLIGSSIIVASILSLFIEGKPIPLFDLFSHGELFIISAPITASALGGLLGSKGISSTRGIVSFCGTFLMFFVGLLCFALLNATSGKAVNVVSFGQFSLLWYFTSIIASLFCILIKEK